jgi:hypothetical protein
MPKIHERLRRLRYCFGFFFLLELLLFVLMIAAGKSRPYSGEYFLFYWLIGPFGASLENRYSLLSDFAILFLVVEFLVNPLLYGSLIYPLVSLKDHFNRNNAAPSIRT